MHESKITVLSNSELMNRFGRLVQTERKITHLVLECIEQIETRQIYLERAYPSLYDFLVKEYGYSPSAAMRRIEAARLLRQVPEIAEKIETGALNLSQLSQVQQAVRLVQKMEGRKVSSGEKRELLFKIENTSQQTTELILAQELALPVQTLDKSQIHRDESVTLTITFSKEQMALLEQVQDLIAHSIPEKKWAEVMTYLAQKEVNRRTRTRIKTKRTAMEISSEKSIQIKSSSSTPNKTDETSLDQFLEGNLNAAAPNHDHRNDRAIAKNSFNQRKPLRPHVRKIILKTQPCCQFKDPLTGKICGSKRFSQVDHRQAIWAGGSNDLHNLQNLCAQHNQFKYKKEAGFHP